MSVTEYSVVNHIEKLISAYEEYNQTPSVIKLSHNMYLILKREAWDYTNYYTNYGPRVDKQLPDIHSVWGIPIEITNDVPLVGIDVN